MASESKWIKREIKGADFGDVRLNNRFGDILENFADSPTKSIPNACKTWAETLAAYRFFSNEAVTPAKILAPHTEATLKRIQQEEVVLVVQDTSEIDFSNRQPIKGMGVLRTENQQGFFLHPSLAITPGKLCLGVVNGHMLCREKLRNHKQSVPISEKESYRWLESYELADQIAQASPSTLVVNVADREADIYELLMQQTVVPRKAHWLIRSRFNRVIFSQEDTKLKTKLHDQIRNTPVIGEVEFVLSRSGEKSNNNAIWKKIPPRKERKVKQEVRVGRVDLVPVERKGERLPSISVYAVHCVEINPPKEEEKVEWFLITSMPIDSIEKAIKMIEWYLCRWQIEVFFNILKNGCKIEELQFDSYENTANCIALYMIVAWRVLYLMMLGRQYPEMDCSVVFEESEWRSTYTMATKKMPPQKPPALKEMVLMIAKLGGFLGRKNDGQPGAKVIWIGLQRMRDFSEAWETYEELKGKICV